MIAFEQYYYFAAEGVECIQLREDLRNSSHPFCLTVRLKSGQELSVSYADKTSREKARRNIVAQIETERRRDTERMFNKLMLLDCAIKKIDRRQLKIWRQIKALLGTDLSLEGE